MIKKEKRGEPLFSFQEHHLRQRILELNTEFDRDVRGLRAVLGEDVESVTVRISEGECAGLIIDEDIASFRIQPLRGEVGELVGHTDSSVEAGGVAGVLVDRSVGLEFFGPKKGFLFLNRRCREVRSLVIEASADYDVGAVFVRVIEGVLGVDGEGPDMTGTA